MSCLRLPYSIQTNLCDFSQKLPEKLKVLLHLSMTVQVAQSIALDAKTPSHTLTRSQKVYKMTDMRGNCEHFHLHIYICISRSLPFACQTASAGSAVRLNAAKSFPSFCKVFTILPIISASFGLIEMGCVWCLRERYEYL